MPQGSKNPNNRVSGPKSCNINGIRDPKPYYLGPWTLRARVPDQVQKPEFKVWPFVRMLLPDEIPGLASRVQCASWVSAQKWEHFPIGICFSTAPYKQTCALCTGKVCGVLDSEAVDLTPFLFCLLSGFRWGRLAAFGPEQPAACQH